MAIILGLGPLFYILLGFRYCSWLGQSQNWRELALLGSAVTIDRTKSSAVVKPQVYPVGSKYPKVEGSDALKPVINLQAYPSGSKCSKIKVLGALKPNVWVLVPLPIVSKYPISRYLAFGEPTTPSSQYANPNLCKI